MSATISLLFGLLVAIVILATLATRLRIPYTILLVLGGLLLVFVPGLPTITLNPELVLVLFLPPLIYSSAWLTSWREFRANLRPILQLSLGLVLMTTIVIAVVAHTIAGLSWPVAFVLGAVVSPTDAVAASATAQQLGLPRRIVTVIEGESMVNDATGLVIYRFAVAALKCVLTMNRNCAPSPKRSMARAINALMGMCRTSSSSDKRCSRPNGRR